jgi:hypothetical protein
MTMQCMDSGSITLIESDHAETKFRLYKAAVAQTEDLKDYIQDLEREKSASTLVKAAAEKELQDLTSQAKTWQGYENGYKQINGQYILLQVEHNDVIAERNDLLRKLEVSSNTSQHQDPTASAQPPAPIQTGTIKSADRDIGMLEKYWGTEKQFVEMKMRMTAADIATVDADIAEITRQLAALREPQASTVVNPGTTESNDEHNEHTYPTRYIGSQAQLLDTIAHPFPVTNSYHSGCISSHPGIAAQSPVHEHVQHQPTTWASRADHGNNAAKRAYVHLSYQGDNVFTAGVTEVAPPIALTNPDDGFEQQCTNRIRRRWPHGKK